MCYQFTILGHELFFSQCVPSPFGTEYVVFSLKLSNCGWNLVSFRRATPSIINSWWLICFGSWWIGHGPDLRVFMLFLRLFELLSFLFNTHNCSCPFWFRKMVFMSLVWLNIFSAYLYSSVLTRITSNIVCLIQTKCWLLLCFVCSLFLFYLGH